MGLHVDIVRNEWHSGLQTLVARAFVKQGRFFVESLDGNKEWEEIASRSFLDPESGQKLDPDEDPDTFLESLHKGMSGSYLFATEAHSQSECSYDDLLTASVRSIDVPSQKGRLWRKRRLLRSG
jgi:hypothetical protein